MSSAAESAKDGPAKEPVPARSVLMVITGPVLRFLATREADMIARGEEPQKKTMVFWPFAAAGMTLFGVGIAGGHYFMKGDVQGMEVVENAGLAAESAAPKGQRRARAGALAREAATKAMAEGGVQAVLEDAGSAANQKSALRTAMASLGLGTVLAVAGAAVIVKTTMWYLKVDNAEAFGNYMRDRLPDQMKVFVDSIRLQARKERLHAFVKEDMGAGAFLERREADRRERSANKLVEKGVLTPLEFEEERLRIAQEREGLRD
ncbi:hypothetical protein T484DRAFT_1976951 [Baffinella frigidus]|nr:hypothetical protein T484DRAFT_1976951 [Cryptophyta sp. CCMP2293]